MLSRLSTSAQWRPAQADIEALFHPCEPAQIQLNHFPKGIDNAHIDVALSSVFVVRATQLVRDMLRHVAAVSRLRGKSSRLIKADMDAFCNAYTGMMEGAVRNAHRASSPEQIQLLQISVIKFLLLLVGDELARLRERLQRARDVEGERSSGRALELHERMVLLAKREASLRYMILSRLFKQIIKLEKGPLRILRKSVLGIAWPLPTNVLFNPLLQQPVPWGGDQLIERYPQLCVDHFDSINRLITGVLRDYLPTWVWPSEQISSSKDRRGTGVCLRNTQSQLAAHLVAETLLQDSLQKEEYMQERYSWLDEPENIELLISPVVLQKSLALNNLSQPKWLAFQRQIRKKLVQGFRRAGLVPWIVAHYEAPRVCQALDKGVPTFLVYQYLAGEILPRDLFQRLSGLQTESSPADIVKMLDRARERLRRKPRDEQREFVHCFIKDFLIFRRDLKQAYLVFRAMGWIRILTDSADIELSRANASLQYFVTPHEKNPPEQRITSHVIIKADVRGSTDIINRLMEQKLNPATYFSLNFFKPISALLDDYGAAKVFVEGDAVILSICEYEDVGSQWSSVSRACGLACKILEVVDSQNSNNKKHGLPQLEIGLGIAFSSESPAFLYDGDQRIMISPAINRADQLSSCSPILRHSLLSRQVSKRGVEVMATLDHGLFEKEHPERLLRFNVNGIELDGPAFDKLNTELNLRPLTPDASLGIEATALYAGRYRDTKGGLHWLVVREAPIHLWMDSGVGPEEEEGRRFYEVIVEPHVIRWAIQKLNHGRRSRRVGDLISGRPGLAADQAG